MLLIFESLLSVWLCLAHFTSINTRKWQKIHFVCQDPESRISEDLCHFWAYCLTLGLTYKTHTRVDRATGNQIQCHETVSCVFCLHKPRRSHDAVLALKWGQNSLRIFDYLCMYWFRHSSCHLLTRCLRVAFWPWRYFCFVSIVMHALIELLWIRLTPNTNIFLLK